ncbi:unnamed protein product, partial [Rotaria magnacalcarata]
PFNEILDKVIQLLNTLRGKDLIRKWQYEQMMPDRTTCEVAHLYFNPKTHKDRIPVRPIESTIHAAATKISKFLDKILRPVFDVKCKDTTIIDGASLITELSKYNKRGLLKSTTLFCTFDIRNLYTMLPQEETLDILMTFFHAHGYRKVKGISMDTIKKLASIILKNNVFVYGKKIYKQTTGGAMGSSLTLTLTNIFMAKWQKILSKNKPRQVTFMDGKYIDDIFMTWNRSEEELRKLLDDVNTWHPNIKLDYKISNSLPFLDVQLTNNNGILSTCVYHKPSAEPYVTPFTSDHPRHVFSNIIKTSIERAIRYSSTFEAFNYERRYIKLMLLYNGNEQQTNDVNTSSLSPINLLVVTLWYLKHYHTERYIATEFNLAQRTVGYSLSSVLDILHSCVYPEFISLPADLSNRTTPHGPEEYHKLIVDSTFIAIPQPEDSTKRKTYYHAKSPTNYALKVQMTCDFSHRIVHVSEFYRGSVHDITILRESGLLEHLNDSVQVIADKGYIGEEYVVTPRKKHHGRELDEEDKDFNRTINSARAAIENINQRLKTYAILGDVYRGDIDDHQKVTKIAQFVSALCNINLNKHPIRK